MYGNQILYNKANETRKKLLLFIDDELRLKKKIQFKNTSTSLNFSFNNSYQITLEQVFTEKNEDQIIYEEIYSNKNKNVFLRSYNKFRKGSVNISSFCTNDKTPEKIKKENSKSISKLILHQKVLPIKIQNYLINKKNKIKTKTRNKLIIESYNYKKSLPYFSKNNGKKDSKFLKDLCNSFKKNYKIKCKFARRKTIGYRQLNNLNIMNAVNNQKLTDSTRRNTLIFFQPNKKNPIL